MAYRGKIAESRIRRGERPPLVLAILDGWGIAPSGPGNPLTPAVMPYLHSLRRTALAARLKASGQWVGLPKGQDGNSEAGHLNLGAGRVVLQDSVRISQAIADGTFFRNASFLAALQHARRRRSNLHLMGLLSNFNSGHSTPDHLRALLTLVGRDRKIPVGLHLFTDGRDTPPFDAAKLLADLQCRLPPNARIATLCGRAYAMDRKKDWVKTERAFRLLTQGRGRREPDAATAIRHAYNRGQSDEFIEPALICPPGCRPTEQVIRDHDAVISFNLRSDRARQLAKVFVQDEFQAQNPGSFRRRVRFQDLCFVAMTDFGPDLDHLLTAFPNSPLPQTLPYVLRDLRQAYLAESEKYAHMTYFLNGGYADPVASEQRLSIQSPPVLDYRQSPGMASEPLTEFALGLLRRQEADLLAINFAAPDMMGHTGSLPAARRGMLIVDRCLRRISQALRRRRGVLVITGDHGNVEEMLNRKTGEVDTEHSRNPVPLLLSGPGLSRRRLRNGKLADVAPTVLHLLGIPQPDEMTGRPLIDP